MATSAASKPFTVKGTRWMCTVWFVAFLLRQRGWAWAIIGITARRAVRMAAPRRRRDVLCAAVLFGCQCQLRSAANANANASSSSKNKSSPVCRAREAAPEGGRKLLPEPLEDVSGGVGLRILLASGLQPLRIIESHF